MDIHQLRCFLAVADERHFGRGAERLHLTTSPVSRSVRELEREIGAPLFVRGYHQVTMTAAGERLAAIAAPLVAGFDGILPAVRSMVAGARDVVRIGSSHLVPPEMVDAVVECAERACSGREVLVEVRPGEDMATLLERDEVDMAVGYLPLGRSGVRSRALRCVQLGVAMRAGDPLAGRESLAVTAIADRTIQLLSPQPPSLAVASVRRQLEERGARSVRVYPASDVMALSEHVRHTGDLSLAFIGVRAGASSVFADPAFAVLPLVDGPELALGVAWRAAAEAEEPLASLLKEITLRWPRARPLD